MITRSSAIAFPAIPNVSASAKSLRERFLKSCPIRLLPLWLVVCVLCAAQSAAAEGICTTPQSESVRKLLSVVELIQTRHADANVAEKLVAKVMEDLAKDSDPYASYYKADAFRELRRDLEGTREDRETISYRPLPGSRAYLRIHSFDERAPQLLLKAIEEMNTATPHGLSGLVLDLRDNPGGLVRSAVAVAAVFLPADALVLSTDGAGTGSKQEMRARPEDYLYEEQDDFLHGVSIHLKTLPLTVLVNRGSASASEILAGALQDHRRALVIGTKTYGKGSVQTIIPLADDTAVKFTTAYFHTPSGRRVEGQGVNPDLLMMRNAKRDVENTEGLSAAVRSFEKIPGSACTLRTEGAVQVVRDIGLLLGRDKDDCQLQQALLTLAAGSSTTH